MSAGPEHDLQRMLASLRVERRLGTVSVVSVIEPNDAWEKIALATINEREGRTYVLPSEHAPDDTMFDGVWLTLSVWSALDAVGLTAAVSTALANAGISCNMFAGAFHDHLLVPTAHAAEAIAVIESIATPQ